jgi:1-deoxy-D-xylulose-5-phosphate synthase
MGAAKILADEGIQVGVVDARFCKPLDGEMLEKLFAAGHPIITVEDHSTINGFGTAVIEHAQLHGFDARGVTRAGIPDRFVRQASRAEQLREIGLDAAGLASTVRDAIARHQATPAKTSVRSRRATAALRD